MYAEPLTHKKHHLGAMCLHHKSTEIRVLSHRGPFDLVEHSGNMGVKVRDLLYVRQFHQKKEIKKKKASI